ncbi:MULTISPECIES: glutamate 5-kinase [Sulfurovum]|uniref:Glutamate 5-kinase n=1 Tax=Sulfurovum xiamenensis TaxID=3019066 RepID=A0ABT7QR61_9BACT|nr:MULTISPECIES: glutamate 5-kinase [Sulfurovum]MDM5263556.1 glutamate 5-kinase [Sulfurovum xiamenensis]
MNQYNRVVIKVGSSVLTEKGEIAKERMLNLVSFIVEVRKKYEVIFVSSGAAAAGYTALKLDKREHISKKVLAAIGQPILMSSYKKKFDIYDTDIAQILLTEDDFNSRKRTEIFSQIIQTSFKEDIIPIVNENDISSTPDQIFGDNDLLAAKVTHHTDSDLLVILSDIDGYYDSNPDENPHAQMLKEVNSISEDELAAVYRPHNEFTSGGLYTKLVAADFLINKKREMFLCSGFDLSTAYEFLMDGKHTKGTLFRAKN